MPISELSSRSAVLQAIGEFDRLGRDPFLERHGFHRSHSVFFRHESGTYDARALAAVAYAHQFPDRPPLSEDPSYTGGRRTAGGALSKLGFELTGADGDGAVAELEEGREYDWQQIGDIFDFAPEYFRTAGGMLARPKLGVLLLVTHPEGGRSFDHGDYWDEDTGDLIYAGRGLTGDQTLDGQNRYVAENSHRLLVLEKIENQVFRYLGEVRSVEHWEVLAPDQDGRQRRAFRFRLRFGGGHEPRRSSSRTGALGGWRSASSFRARPFDPDRTVSPRQRGKVGDPDRRAVLTEQADSVHQATVKTLGLWLRREGWTDLEEVAGATDLQARGPDRSEAQRVLFEIKGISATSERSQVRGGLAQLLEYRLFLGEPSDLLCLITDRPISDRRLQLLDELDIGHAYFDGGEIAISGTAASNQIFGTGPY